MKNVSMLASSMPKVGMFTLRMATVGMLACGLIFSCSGACIAQNEAPLEPIPLPAPVGQSNGAAAESGATNNDAVQPAGYDEVVMPLDGPVFPENNEVQASHNDEEPPLEPIEMGAPAMSAPVETYVVPPVYEVAPTTHETTSHGMVVAPSANQAGMISGQVHNGVVQGNIVRAPAPVTHGNQVIVAPHPQQRQPNVNYYVDPTRQPVVVQQTYYQHVPTQTYQRVSYRQVTPMQRAGGVAVYRVNPYSGVATVAVTAPTTYAVGVHVPVRPVSPYAAYRAGFAPGMPPGVGPVVPYPIPAYVPGQPVRNAIRSRIW